MFQRRHTPISGTTQQGVVRPGGEVGTSGEDWASTGACPILFGFIHIFLQYILLSDIGSSVRARQTQGISCLLTMGMPEHPSTPRRSPSYTISPNCIGITKETITQWHLALGWRCTTRRAPTGRDLPHLASHSNLKVGFTIRLVRRGTRVVY
jgi:hypothetical protein